MLATRPGSSASAESSAAAASTTAAARAQPEEMVEKRIAGVNRDALKEERRPLLDLDDVELLQSELSDLAACFDVPPPPPLSIRRQEPTATLSSWTAASEPRHIETRYVAPPAVSAALSRGQELQGPEQQGTRVSDYSSLYSPPTQRAASTGQLYPALIPTAPSTEAMRMNARAERAGAAAATASSTLARGTGEQAASQWSANRGGAASASTAPTAAATGAVAQWGASSEATAAATAASELAAAGVAVAGEGGGPVARAMAGEATGEVVDELLSENERLRLIIQEMSEELESASQQLKNGPSEPSLAAGGQTQTRALALRPEVATASASGNSHLTRYPGAQAEAARRQREQNRQLDEQLQAQEQQQQYQEEQTALPGQTARQENPRQSLRRGIFVHFKCDNCPQWLKVPGHAQLVYCPTCSHTSQMTAGSTIHFPPNNQLPSAASSRGAAAETTGAQEGAGWLGYIKGILAS